MQDVLALHSGLAELQAKFKADPPDLEAGRKLATAYANRGKVSQAKKVIRKLEMVDPENKAGRLTEPYLALGEYYLDEEEKHQVAIRWYTKVVDHASQPETVAQARYRIAVAYFDSRTQHATKSNKFGAKLLAAREAIDALQAMDGVPDELRSQTKDLADSVSEDLALHEASKKKS
jgi:tetratricopeptide (TPR) repeat protein